jgi:hypothetical protein
MVRPASHRRCAEPGVQAVTAWFDEEDSEAARGDFIPEATMV